MKKQIEVIKVLPEYQTISKKRKKDVLLVLLKWIAEELNKI